MPALTDEQIEFRRSGFGSSEMACVMGLVPKHYRQLADVLNEKAGAPFNPPEFVRRRMAAGTLWEPYVLREWSERTGNAVMDESGTPVMMRSDEAPIVSAGVDGLTSDGQTLIEIKTVTGSAYRKQPHEEHDPEGLWTWGVSRDGHRWSSPTQAPLHYQIQVQTLLHLTGLDRAVLVVAREGYGMSWDVSLDVADLAGPDGTWEILAGRGGAKLYEIPIARDDERIAEIIEAANREWPGLEG